jgi:uncharacterized membrane protein
MTRMPDAAEQQPAQKSRFTWLDTLRGFALLCMASYHFIWDLADFGYLDAAFPSTGWPRLYARAIASTFLFMAGFSLVLAHGRGVRWQSFWRRWALIAASAAAVTLGTWWFMPQGFIFFGILHEMALASLLGLAFLRLPWFVSMALAVAIIAFGVSGTLDQFRAETFDTPFLWWVGLSTSLHNSFDYVPLLPWFGPFLLGLSVARIEALQTWLRRRSGPPAPSSRRDRTPLAFLGRHSLVFYLLHQPVLIGALWVFSLAVPAPQVSPEAKYLGSCEMTCKPDRDPAFCLQFCGCTLDRLQQTRLLAPFQSGAISVKDNQQLKDIAIECSTVSQ